MRTNTKQGMWAAVLPAALALGLSSAASGWSLPANETDLGCTYRLSPTNRPHGYGATTGTVSVITTSNCAWTVVNSNAWLTVLLGTNGIGGGSVTYALDANPSFSARTGIVTIADQVFTVIQAAFVCTYKLSPTNRVHGYGANTALVSVATSSNCAWTAVTTNDWITLPDGREGTGDGSVTYTVASNPDLYARTGGVQVVDQFFTVRQRGTCSYSISPTNRNHGYGATAGILSVYANSSNCAWSVLNTNDWITVTSATEGIGDGAVSYTVEANPYPAERAGVVFIGDQLFNLIQDALPCTYKLSPIDRTHGRGAATGIVSIATSSTCPWNVVNTNDWITFLSDTNLSGNGNVTYLVAANTSPNDRIGLVGFGDQFFAITQRGIFCTYELSPTNRVHGYGATTATLSVSTSSSNCTWSVVNTNDWITVTSGTSGAGEGRIVYTLAANPNFSERTGVLQVEDQFCTIRQQALVCAYALSATNAVHGSGAETGAVSVATSAGCGWTVANTNGWITLLSAATNSGDGIVSYAVVANAGASPRAGVLSLAGQSFTVNQAGWSCTYKVSPTNRPHGYGATSGAISVTTGDNCPWSAINTNDWITITSGTNYLGSNSVSYTAAANTMPAERLGLMLIADQIVSLRQRGITCAYELSPLSPTHGAGTETGLVTVTTSSNCAWGVVNTNDWITLTSGTNGMGNGSVSYSVAANFDPIPRTGTVAVADQSFSVNQAALICTYKVSPTNRPHGYGATTGIVNVTTLSPCAWSVVNTNPWISLLSNPMGAGTGSVTYALEVNTSLDGRMGVMLIANQPVTVTQAGWVCTYKISPTNRVHGCGATNGTVTVTTTNNCPWSVLNTNDWITVTSATEGAGSGTVTYMVEVNPNPTERTGVLLIAGQALTLRQRAWTNTGAWSFESITLLEGGQVKLTLIGAPGGPWELHASPDLVQWQRIAGFTNTLGRVEYTDTVPPDAHQRFYRAVAP